MTVEELKVIISANTEQFRREIDNVNQRIAGMQQQVERASRQTQSRFSGITKTVKRMAAAFAMVQVADFGKQCIEIASDLEEVQNVVDVTFGAMSENINKFAENALNQFGLSELSAKQYASTMGAMLKSSGLAAQAAEMSKVLTGLTGDIASFYNLDAGEAFMKIRAGISGETEPLKQLGINMSVANLEAFALSQGIEKAYDKMSQAEQTMLRYNYLLSVTGDVQGDFARTSGNWANQVRILAENFKSLMVILGQGLIGALRPALQWLNAFVQRLTSVAAGIKVFIETLFGVKAPAASMDKTFASVASNTNKTDSNISNVAKNLEKVGKKAKGALAGFDKLNTLSQSSGSGSGDTVLPDYAQAMVDYGNYTDSLLNGSADTANKISKKYTDMFADVAKKIKNSLPVKIIQDLGKVIKKVFNNAIKPALSWVIKNADEVINGLTMICAAVLGFRAANKVVGIINKINASMRGFTAAQKVKQGLLGMEKNLVRIVGKNYFGILAGALAITAVDMYKTHKEMQSWADSQLFGDLAISADDMARAVEGLEGGLYPLKAAFEEFDTSTQMLADDFNAAYTEMDMFTLKYGDMGQKITEEDGPRILEAIKSMSDTSLAAIDESMDYSYNMWSTIFTQTGGKIDEGEKEILGKIISNGTTKQNRIREIERDITGIYNGAINDRRELNQSEITQIQNLLAEMQNLTETELRVKKGDYDALYKDIIEGRIPITQESYQGLIDKVKEKEDEVVKVAEETRARAYADAEVKFGADPEAYQAAIDAADRAYFESIAEVDTKTLKMYDAMLQSLQDTTNKKSKKIKEELSGITTTWWDELWGKPNAQNKWDAEKRLEYIYKPLNEAAQKVDTERAAIARKYELMGGDINKGLASGVTSNLNKVKEAGEDLSDTVSDSFTAKSKINSPSKLYKDYGKYIDQGLTNGITDSDNLPVNAITRMCNRIIDKSNSFIDRFICGWKDAFEQLGNVSGDVDFKVSTANISTPRIPRLANGGIAYADTLAVIGDNPRARIDPEVVSPLSKLGDLLTGALREAGQSGPQIVEVSVSLDGSVLAKQMVGPLEREARRRGAVGYASISG